MRLSQKLILFVLAAAVIPLSVAGFWLLNQSEVELSARLEREQTATAMAAAEGTSAQLLGAMNAMAQSASLIDWEKASREEVAGGLRLLLGQSTLVLAVVLVDPARQAELPPPEIAQAGARLEIDTATLAGVLPLDTLSAYGERGLTAVGPAQPGAAGTWLPVAIQVSPKGPRARMIVAAVALSQLDGWLAERAPPGAELELVDGDRRVVAASSPGTRLGLLRPSRWQVVEAKQPLTRTSDAEQVATAVVPGRLGLSVVVTVPMEVARAPIARLRRTVLTGMGVTAVLLVIAALFFVRGLTRRLEKVAGVADAFARGELSSRVDVGGQDELSDLSHTFNQMGAELETARGRLLRWNDELKQKVDEALANLRAAQAQLLEAQKLAALGQLGAGVAHEINNPLCGILGNAQLLLLDRPEGDPDFDTIKRIEDSAKRCRDITENLLRFSQSKGEVHLTPVDLNAVVRAAMVFEQPRHDEAGITVVLGLAPGQLDIDGDGDALQQVLAQLCSNARTAMKSATERTLTVSTRREGDEVLLVVEDTGKGISAENLPRVFEPFFTTKDVWSNIGLGLSVAYRIVEEHQGRIEAFSDGVRGAKLVVHLKPAGTVMRPADALKPDLVVGGGTGVGIVG